VTRTGGRISLLEVAEPRSGILRAGFRIWFRRVVPFIGSIVSDRAAYTTFPSRPRTAEQRADRRMLNQSGFSAVNHDTSWVVSVNNSLPRGRVKFRRYQIEPKRVTPCAPSRRARDGWLKQPRHCASDSAASRTR